jgi:hypothetical protein
LPIGLSAASRRKHSGDNELQEPAPSSDSKPQLLHLVFGGELKTLAGHEFRDLGSVDVVGIYPDYQTAYAAWKAAAQRSVDNAMMRYFIVHLHRLLEPNGSSATRQTTPTS